VFNNEETAHILVKVAILNQGRLLAALVFEMLGPESSLKACLVVVCECCCSVIPFSEFPNFFVDCKANVCALNLDNSLIN